MTRTRWLLVIAALAIVMAVGVLAQDPREGGGSAASDPLPTTSAIGSIEPTASPARSNVTALAGLVDLLEVRAEDRSGYNRSLFELWVDADGDGCDTRREVLVEEAVLAPTVMAGCQLVGGRWRSLYDGVETTDPGTFDIDHVVPLAEAWDSGASSWTAARREAFANDLGVPWSLIAVTATSNRAKSDADPADWLPPLTDVRCAYVADWLATKIRWALAIDTRERDVLLPLASGCAETRAIVPAP